MAETSDGGILTVPYGSFTAYTPALPQFYWDVYSSEQRIKHICYEIEKIIAYANMLGININATHDDVVELRKQFEQFKNGEMLDFYEKQIKLWIDANMERIMSRAIKFVMFGINKDGRFVAYVPESWSQIQFDFGAVYGRSDYHRIILRFDAEGNAINNTYSYSLAQTQPLKQLIADLEINAKRTDAAYDTLFTNMDTEVKHDYD